MNDEEHLLGFKLTQGVNKALNSLKKYFSNKYQECTKRYSFASSHDKNFYFFFKEGEPLFYNDEK